MGCGASAVPREIVITETKAESPRDPPRLIGDETKPLTADAIQEQVALQKDAPTPTLKMPTLSDLTTSPSAATDLPDDNPETKSSEEGDSDSDSGFGDLTAAFDADVEDAISAPPNFLSEPNFRSEETAPGTVFREKEKASEDPQADAAKKSFSEERRRSKTEFEIDRARIQAQMEAENPERIFVRRKSTHNEDQLRAFRGDSVKLGEWRKDDRMEMVREKAKSRLQERRLSCGERTAHDVGFKIYLQERRTEMMAKRAELEGRRSVPMLSPVVGSRLAARRAHRAKTLDLPRNISTPA